MLGHRAPLQSLQNIQQSIINLKQNGKIDLKDDPKNRIKATSKLPIPPQKFVIPEDKVEIKGLSTPTPQNILQNTYGTPMIIAAPNLPLDLSTNGIDTEERRKIVEEIKKNPKEPEGWRCLLTYEMKNSPESRDVISRLFYQATHDLPTQKLRKNPVFVNIWLHYILFQGEHSVDEAKNSIKFLKTNRIGLEEPSFYLVWAQMESKNGPSGKSKLILEKGVSKNLIGGEILKVANELCAQGKDFLHVKIAPLAKQIDDDPTITLQNKMKVTAQSTHMDNDITIQTVGDQPPVLPSIRPREKEKDEDDKILSILKRRKFQEQKKSPPVDSPNNLTESIQVNGVLYQKISLLGKGGSSKVYKVFNPRKQICAVKKVNLKGVSKQTLQGFINEINLLKQLVGKPNIIQYIDSEVRLVDGLLFLVMECGDCDLSFLLKSKQLNENQIRLYWQQMLEAVQTIHNEKIVHSDLKPANFLLVRGTIKLIDFGIANSISNDTTNIVRDNQVGTVNYMSPEAINENPVATTASNSPKYKLGRSSDIWSLGCILYQMVYGKTPFTHLNMIQAIHAITDVNHLIPFTDIPNKNLLDVLKATLQRDHTKRPSIPELLSSPFLVASVEKVEVSRKSVSELELLKLVQFISKDPNVQSELLICLEKGTDITHILNKVN
jgi:serine/threonine-protein kinase TTK/MPS1